MSRAATDYAPIAAPPLRDAMEPARSARARGWQFRLRLLQKLALSTAVWMLYVPHFAILKLLGPRLGPRWARAMARLHWLFTFLGAQRSVRHILQEMYPHFQTRLSVSSMLRKHLELKHECFARFKLFNGPRECSQSELIWELDPEMRAKFDRARSSGKGLIIVGYHFGFFRLSTSAIPQTFPWCDATYVSHRTAHYTGDTIAPIADMALRKAFRADRQSGARIHYIEPESSIVRIYRMLLAGETVALAADGAFAKDFLAVPFLGRKLRMACGWARIAAATGANVLILLDTKIDHRRRRMWVFDHVQVDDKSEAAIFRAVAGSARVLETFVRREPWAWHPWQRMRQEEIDDGSQLLMLAELGRSQNKDRAGTRLNSCATSNGYDVLRPKSFGSRRNIVQRVKYESSDGGSAMNSNGSAQNSNVNRDPRLGVRRVAIVANSFTPYRIYVHGRIVKEVPEVELWTVMTHGNSYNRWQGLEPPPEIRPVMFGNGEPTIEQTKLKFALREWRKFGRIIRWIDEHQIEAVICQGFGDVGRLRLLRWCHRHGIPCFLTADCNICGDVRPGLKRVLKHLVVGQAIRWSSGVMPCGEYGRKLFERYGATGDRTFMFPLISDLELFANSPPEAMRQVREQFGFDPQRRRILYCGRMMQVKRPDLTAQAFIALADERPDWDLVLMGDGPLRERAVASIPPRLQERVKWLGLVHDTTKLASVFAQCDVLVLPSDKEPWGMVVIEAAAAGLALVMTDSVGASPELVSNGENGRVFRPGDLSAFIDALREVTRPDRIDAMKRNSRQVLARWMAASDPVDGFRAAMASCGLIPCRAERSPSLPAPNTLRPEVFAADEMAINT